MAVQYVFNTDTGASDLSSTSGTLITVLDAVLVNGFNSKTVTITRSSNTATANCTGHGFRTGMRLNVSGADQADYNGNFYVTVTDANNFTYTVANSPATPATGTITAKVAPLGWTKSFSGTNKAVYRPGAGNQYYLRVDHTGTTTPLLRGYVTMSDVDTGTEPFPTTVQDADGLAMFVTASAARDWFIVGDEKRFYMQYVASNVAEGSDMSGSQICGFGDYTSYKSGDVYNTFIHGLDGTAAATNSTGHAYAASVVSSQVNCFSPRSYTQSGTAVTTPRVMPCHYLIAATTVTSGGTSSAAYPNGPDGGLLLSPVYIGEYAAAALRGRLEGVWGLGHSHTNFNNKDTFTGSGDLSGKTFIIMKHYNAGATVYEISNTW
jgi:hypothetical protein